MMKRILETGFCIVLILAVCTTAADANHSRMTPLVRAVQMAREAVVNIHSEKTTAAGESLFNSRRTRKVNGMGTGVVIDERGYIVTNQHVIDGVDSLRVTMDDGSTYTARVISYDKAHDLAIIKIDSSKPLQVMPIGISSDLMLGETVFAVGNAFGYEHTVTSGIISALSRDVEVNEKQSYKNLIQTDASINPGNSGGPLLNLNGEVIGINVAIRAGAQRIGFAIPIDDARKVIARLLSVEELGQVQHGLLTEDVNKVGDQRLVIQGTRPGSPAAAAGFAAGDVVTRVGDLEVHDTADLERALLGRGDGDSIEIVVKRDEHEEKLNLTLAAIAGSPRPAAPAMPEEEPSLLAKAWSLLGMRLEDIRTEEKQIVSPRYRGGLRVAQVRAGSPAALNGVREGDILVGLHIWETLNTENVSYVLEHPQLNSFNPLKFYIVRRGETLYGRLPLVSRK